MKFLCDSCKAKYQIADEKVAGKTVRMKCRKCGHLIEIRAGQAIAEPSALHHGLPPEELSRIYEEPAAEAPKEKPPVGGVPRAPSPAAGAPAARKPMAPAPRPGGGGAASPLRVAGGASAAAAKAQPSAASAAPRPAGGLASAFTKSVSAEPKQPKPIEDSGVTRAIDMSSVAATEEWYVGISGVPVGPVRLTELRAKAATGQVTEDSLVWREGFEEWLPLRTFPDLVDLLRSAQSSERMSLNSGPAAQARQGLSNPFNAPAPQPAGRAAGTSSAPARAANVIPIRASDRPEAEKPVAAAEAADLSLGDPFAAPPPPVGVAAPAQPPRDEPIAPMAARAAAAAAAADDDYVPPRQHAPGRIPVAAWIAIVLALATGVTAGSVLFSKPPPPPTVQIVTVTAPGPTAPAAPTASPDSVAVAPADSASAKDDPAGPRKVAGPMPGGVAAAKPTSTAPLIALAPLPGVPDGPSPSPLGPSPAPGPGPAPAPPSGGESLPASKLQEVVNANRNALKRACWEPALSAKGGSATSARVTISFTVGSNGRVSRSSASGGEAFPTLGTCIANRVRNWSFPAGFADTPTSATFSFVSQGG
jgi:predicted Zn finger-like uncharacterized protein